MTTAQRHETDRARLRLYVGGNDRDPITLFGERDKRVRGEALHQHARPDVGNVACRLEPQAQPEIPPEQQRFVGKLRDFQHLPPAQPMSRGERCRHVDRIEDTTLSRMRNRIRAAENLHKTGRTRSSQPP